MAEHEPPPSLADLQHRFQGYVLGGSPGIGDAVVADDDASRARRLAIYADGYALRLDEALRADYRGLHAMLGDGDFARLARAYLAAQPSRYRSIRWFGQHLPDYLARTPPWRGQPLAAEMAAFDWALSLALDAADVPALAIEHLAGLAPEDWPGLQFQIQPAVSRLDLNWNVVQLRKALMDDETPPQPQTSSEPVAWLVWRGDFLARYRSLPAHEAWALDVAAGGVCFAEICEGLGRWIDPAEAPMAAAGLLKRWVVDGLLRHPG